MIKRSQAVSMDVTLAIVIFIGAIFVFYAIFAIGFLVQKVNEVFNPSLLKKTEIVKFNLAKVGELRR